MTNPFSSGSNPFEFLLGDLLKMLGTQKGMHAEMARQMAVSVANDPEGETVDPIDRINHEELVKILDIHLQDFPAIPQPIGGRNAIEVVTKIEWASRTVSDWEKFAAMFEQQAELQQHSGENKPSSEVDQNDNFSQMIQNLSKMVGPSMIAMQMGSMVGHLSKVAFGSFEIPVPRPTSSVPMLIPKNIEKFASEWELPLEQVRLWSTLREVVMWRILSAPVVSERIENLIERHIHASKVGFTDIQERLSHLDLSNPESLQEALSDPSGIFSSEDLDEIQLTIVTDISTTMSIVEGIASYALSTIGGRLLGNSASIEEAFMRRRIERSDGERLSEQIFGIEISRAGIERGQAFVQGVIERAGEDGLAPIWSDKGSFPTPAELEAPGLWLARLEFEG